jgi:V8-like Glu-specific endopeptidase
MRTGLISATVLLGLGGCLGPGAGPLDVDEANGQIVGGVVDNGDPSVVLIYAQVPGANGGSLCTGTVISPHLVLTAAHCVHPQLVGATAKFTVFTGTNFDNAQPNQLLAVKAVHYNTQWQNNNLNAGHDIAVVVLTNATTLKPIPYNKSAMAQAMLNQPVRFVGYGITSGAANDAGIKRQVTGALKAYNNVLLQFDNSTKGTCSGDSGGPAFMTIGGVETVVGVTSFGDEDCAVSGFDTRVDTEQTFVNPYVAMYDPTMTPTPTPTPPSTPPSNPAPTPPANPDQTPSPSNPGQNPQPPVAGLLEAGAQCTADAQCGSGVCGLGNRGTLVCVAAKTGGNKTLGGCSFAGGAESSPGVALALILGLGMLLRHGLRRRR